MILLVENKWIAVILRDLKKELVLLSLILTSQELWALAVKKHGTR
jgi:hypothetical protein